jgi:hypothetical protein
MELGEVVRSDSAARALPRPPPVAEPTYGKGAFEIAQAHMSDLKGIRKALHDPPDRPDLIGLLATSAAALAFASRVLRESDRWRLPTSMGDLLALILAAVSVTVALLKFIKALKPKALNVLAIEHVNAMIGQLRTADEPNIGRWERAWAFFMKIL